MGLDFYVVKVQKGYQENIEKVIHDWSYEKFHENELAYGRKSWELVYELQCDTHNSCISELTLENWINLQEKLAPIGPSLEEIQTAFRAEDETYDTPQYNYLRKQYYKWYDLSFPDGTPQLGYDFSVSYMRTFWEAADKVLKYLEDPNYEVWMIASY